MTPTDIDRHVASSCLLDQQAEGNVLHTEAWFYIGSNEEPDTLTGYQRIDNLLPDFRSLLPEMSLIVIKQTTGAIPARQKRHQGFQSV